MENDHSHHFCISIFSLTHCYHCICKKWLVDRWNQLISHKIKEHSMWEKNSHFSWQLQMLFQNKWLRAKTTPANLLYYQKTFHNKIFAEAIWRKVNNLLSRNFPSASTRAEPSENVSYWLALKTPETRAKFECL